MPSQLFTVLTFIGTWNAGATTPGEPYVARFGDEHDNLLYKDIPRPEVISKYFSDSDAVDCHKKSRQGDLVLEEHWRTDNCWLSLTTTFIGLTTTDTWNLSRHHCTSKSGFPGMSIKRFAECLVYDLFNKPWNEKRPAALVLGCPEVEDTESCEGGVEVNIVTPCDELGPIRKEHVRVPTERVEAGKRSGAKVCRACRIKAAGCVCYKTKTTVSWECGHESCKKQLYKTNKNVRQGIFICENPACLETHHFQVQQNAKFFS